MTDGRGRAAAPGGGKRPSGATRAETIKRRLIAAFTERLPYKATALFFALVLWLIVSAEEPTSGPVPVQFEPVVDTSLDLVGNVPNVTAYVVGARSDLLRLTSTPLTLHLSVGREAPDSLTVRLDTLPLTRPSGVNVQVTRLQPEVVTLRFAGDAQRTVPVRSALRILDDFGRRITVPPEMQPESVRISGPRRRVAEVDAVPTISADLVVRDTQPLVVPLDTADLRVRVTPAQVRVRVPIAPDTLAPPDTTPSLAATVSPRNGGGPRRDAEGTARARRGIPALASATHGGSRDHPVAYRDDH